LKVLVTGGAGFIGSHIVDELLKEGNDVVIVDNLATGFHHNLNPAATFYPVSIADRKLKKIFKLERPDAVIHEAAQTVVTRSVHDPIYDAQVNILGSINLLNNCVSFNVSKVVYASSCAVYGTPNYVPLDEDHTLNALSPYGVSKQAVEKYLYTYHNTHGLNYCALRYSNVYGPRQNGSGEAGVVAIFIRQMLSGQQPKIYGNGSKTRSYVYVGDVVTANMLALKSGASGVFNIGTSEETSDQRIFNLISSFCVYDSPPRYVDERPGEIRRMCLDTSRASEVLGWTAAMTLEAGIAITVNSHHGKVDLVPHPRGYFEQALP